MSRIQRQLVEAMQAHLATGVAPAVPDAGRDLWAIYIGIARSRTYHAAGPNPIAYAEIEAYCRLYRWPLEPHHVDVLVAMDRAWLDAAAERMAGGGASRAALPMTPGLFDAVFG